MSMVIRSNMSALRTYNLLNVNQSHAQKHMLKVSTGMKINSAQDDASAYSISERMRVRIRALDQAYQNTQNGSSMIKTAEGAVSNILETLRTLKEKAIDAANDSNTDEDRAIIQKEFNQLVDQIDDDALVTFNGMYLLDYSRNNTTYTDKAGFVECGTVMLNKNLALDTDPENDSFSSLKSRTGNSLGIKDDDKIIWSFFGTPDEGTFHGELKGSDKLKELISNTKGLNSTWSMVWGGIHNHPGGLTSSYKNKFDQLLYAPPGIIFSTGESDIISGFTLKVLDSQGNINRYATAALQFSKIQHGEMPTGDHALSFQVGASANQNFKVGFSCMQTWELGLKTYWGRNTMSISTKDDANLAIDACDRILNYVLDQQTSIGAALSRLEYTATNLTTSYTNDTASESVIRDADMATEMSGYVRYNVLTQSAQAMLAQANQNPLNVLALLSGET